MKPILAPIAAAIVLTGCGQDLADQAADASGSVLLACQGNRVTKDYVPAELSFRPANHEETSWYREYFEENLGAEGFLEYTSVPGYFEKPPEVLSERPIEGNTLPHETYAISYYYVDDDFSLHPMDLFFGNFPEPIIHNSAGGELQFPYTVYVTAPEDARYVVIRHHDSPMPWEYQKTDGDWVQGMEEVWYARPADQLVRVDGERSAIESAPLEELRVPELGGCRLTYAWRDERDDLYGGEDDEVRLRDEQRALEASFVETRQRSGGRIPQRRVYPNAPGMAQADNPKNKYFGFPLVGFTEEDALEALRSGEIDAGWKDGKWNAPVL